MERQQTLAPRQLSLSRQVWEDTGESPDHGDLEDELPYHKASSVLP